MSFRAAVTWRAVAALAAGIMIAPAGLAIEPVRWLYDYAWFAGLAVSAIIYLALMRMVGMPGESAK